MSSNFNALYAPNNIMKHFIIVIVILVLLFLVIGYKYGSTPLMVSTQNTQNFTPKVSSPTSTGTSVPTPTPIVSDDGYPRSGGIVNFTKKITGETSHNKRVAFGSHADVLKYSPDTGKNLAFNKVKIKDHVVEGTKKIMRKDAEKMIIDSVLAEDAAASTSIEDIILGTLAL